MRRATRAHGAGETGLAKLIDLTAIGSAGDALITVSLASTLFFSVPTGEARGQVAVYLLVTMAPFAVLAPVVGPLLDRLRHGRRWVISGTFVLRAVLALVMATAVSGDTEDPFKLYPAAFGVLVGTKAYGVARAAAMPRLLPRALNLVTANARLSIASLAALSAAAPLGAGLVALTSPAWALRLAAVVLVVGAVLSVRLPARLDDAPGGTALLTSDQPDDPDAFDPLDPLSLSTPPGGPEEAAGHGRQQAREQARVRTREEPLGGATSAQRLRARLAASRQRRAEAVGPAVVRALRANAAIRAFAGFLLLHLAFLLRAEPFPGPDTALIAAAAAAAGVGSAAGASLGAMLRRRPPELTVLLTLAGVTVAALLGWLLFGLVAVMAVSVAAGLAQTLGKLALDALVQRDVAENVRASAFARSETVLQLSWVIGAGAGTLLHPDGGLGLGLAAAVLAAALALVARSVLAGRRARLNHLG
ncbi:MFS transporter [Motilibacter sp. E257]|uniref:MFS transporter n=2 Tax=Motilibacter deserti TaxID=2714956 RepID=A0ABX0H339_9ACTN|nr:MFS transporter [Motilibacter deserti]NHC16205.1 MFS transporter [Motilibacter deserti]